MSLARSLWSRISAPAHHAGLDDPRRDAEAFAGRMTERQDLNPAERLLQAAAWGKAVGEALARGPAAGRVMVDHAGPCGTAERVGYLLGARVWIDPGPHDDVVAIAERLGRAIAGGSFTIPGDTVDAAVIVVVERRFLPAARAGWRHAWRRGPWLTVAHSTRLAHAPPLELLAGSTRILGLDALAALAAAVFEAADGAHRQLPDGAFQTLGRELTRRCVDAWRPPEHASWDRRSWVREELLLESLPQTSAPDLQALRRAAMEFARSRGIHLEGVRAELAASPLHVGLATPRGANGLSVVANRRADRHELSLVGRGRLTGAVLAELGRALAG